MFEKEARKWVKEHTEIDYQASYGEFPIEPSAIKSFKAGAEFGYNKAKEEMQKNGLALQSDMDKTIEQNISLKEQIEKMKCCNRTSYIKGLRTMANAVKKYDREYGAWTDYVENTVNRVLNNLLKEIKEK